MTSIALPLIGRVPCPQEATSPWLSTDPYASDELPACQEEPTEAIVAAIPVKVEQAEFERVRNCEPYFLSAYEHCLPAASTSAQSLMPHMSRPANTSSVLLGRIRPLSCSSSDAWGGTYDFRDDLFKRERT